MLDLAAPLDATVSKFEGHNSYVCYFSNKILYSTIPTVSRMGKSQPLNGGGARACPVLDTRGG